MVTKRFLSGVWLCSQDFWSVIVQTSTVCGASAACSWAWVLGTWVLSGKVRRVHWGEEGASRNHWLPHGRLGHFHRSVNHWLGAVHYQSLVVRLWALLLCQVKIKKLISSNRQLSNSSTYSKDTGKPQQQSSTAELQKPLAEKNSWKMMEADTAKTGRVRSPVPASCALFQFWKNLFQKKITSEGHETGVRMGWVNSWTAACCVILDGSVAVPSAPKPRPRVCLRQECQHKTPVWDDGPDHIKGCKEKWKPCSYFLEGGCDKLGDLMKTALQCKELTQMNLSQVSTVGISI